MSRAERIHHRERLKRQRRNYWGRDLSDDPKSLAKVVKCPQVCSCNVCGNQRKHEGETMQERKAAMREIEDYE